MQARLVDRGHTVGRILVHVAATVLALAATAPRADAGAAPPTWTPIVLQLKWHHQFQFAGYYAAEALGYYREAGLDVVVREGGPDRPPIPTATRGIATFGVTDSDVVLARLQGQPLVVCAAIFQHSPYILLSRADRGIRTPADLVGRRVMVSGDQGAAQIRAMQVSEGVDPARVDFVQQSWTLDDLVAGKVDAISAYAMVEPTQLRARGVEPAVLRSLDYGVDFYGDTLFTTGAQVEDHPEQTAAFVRASLRGWEYAMRHPEEMADRILAMPGVRDRGITRELLLAEYAGMIPYVLPEVIEVGHMNPSRWARTAETFRELGMVARDRDLAVVLDGFTYSPGQQPEDPRVRWAARIGGVGLVGALVVGIWNLQMRRRVRERTEALRVEVAQRKQAEQELREGEDRYRRQRNALIALTTSDLLPRSDLDATLRHVTETCARTLGVARVGIWRFTPDRSAIDSLDEFDERAGAHAAGTRLRVAAAPVYFRALEEGDVLAAGDARLDSRTRDLARDYLEPLGIGAMLDAAVRHGNHDLGVLCVEHVGGVRAWRADEEAFVTAMATFVALALLEAERRRAEARVAEQAALLDKAQDAIIVRDLADRVTYWNKGAERIYGWSAGEVLGRSIVDLLYRDRATYDEACAEVLARGEWTGELAKANRAGETVYAEGRWTLVRRPDGTPESILAIDTDITARKQLEQQFLRAQRLESIGTLAGGIAHDLNNVLAPIMMATELLKGSATDRSSQAVLETMSTSVRRGADMVKQVLSFARGLEGRRVELQARHLIRDVEKLARDTFPKNINVTTELPEDLWPIVGDPTQLHQVVLNLCVNARDAMPDGGRLRLAGRNAPLDAAFVQAHLGRAPGPHVCLTIEDTGTGIPADVLDKMYDPFFTTKDVGKGTGLGLSTSLAIVKSHGGFFDVSSTVGKGTRFDLYLPATPASVAVDASSPQAETQRGHGELVLVVDDEPPILELVRRVLESSGYRVLTAVDGAGAIAIFEQRHAEIAVVLTDMMMPVMDGAALIAALRAIAPDVRVIAASGMAARTDLAALRVRRVLAKPYSASQVLEALRDALGNRDASTHT